MIPDLEQVRIDKAFDFHFISKDGKINKYVRIKFTEEPKFISDGGIKGINVGKLFFEKFQEKEQIAILWHEYYHKEFSWIFPNCNFLSKLFYEYWADKYSAIKNNINDCLNMLNIVKEIYNSLDNKEKRKYLKKHPPISCRIKRIQELKEKMENRK